MKSLYRKYRPVRLDEVVGQEQVTTPISKAIQAGKVNHAYLFVGPRGCGKTSVARMLAHEVNGFPYQIEDDYVDIIEIDGASNRGIDNIRELREKVAIAPTAGKYKVYIIDEVHMLTKEAFNALLKTLEEPPEHVIFIMATTDAYKVPVTITSRAQTYTFKLADAGTMHAHLRGICDKEGIKITDEALGVVVKRGGGSFRDSLSLLDQISTLSSEEITKELVISAMGLPSDVKITTLLEAYIQRDIVKITTELKDLLLSGIKAETLAEEMITAIIYTPKPELMPLLAKLPEVKAPYAEARLLVALCDFADTSAHGLVSSEHHTLGSRDNRPSGEPVGAVRNIRSSSTDLKMQAKASAEPLDDAPSRDVATSAVASQSDGSQFSWEEFFGNVMRLNDGIAGQLKLVDHDVSNGTLNIYPKRKITQTILGRDNNRKILVEAAHGLKVVVHEVKDNPNREKDALISKMSAIMGGEVQNDGGENPF